jgi:hypothetical protein
MEQLNLATGIWYSIRVMQSTTLTDKISIKRMDNSSIWPTFSGVKTFLRAVRSTSGSVATGSPITFNSMTTVGTNAAFSLATHTLTLQPSLTGYEISFDAKSYTSTANNAFLMYRVRDLDASAYVGEGAGLSGTAGSLLDAFSPQATHFVPAFASGTKRLQIWIYDQLNVGGFPTTYALGPASVLTVREV